MTKLYIKTTKLNNNAQYLKIICNLYLCGNTVGVLYEVKIMPSVQTTPIICPIHNLVLVTTPFV
jgi:hypothetical protein